MSRIVVSTSFVFDIQRHAHHPAKGTSQTMPGQDISVRAMFSRFVQERPLPVVGQPYFSGDGEESFLDIDRMTLQEQLDLKRSVDAKVAAIQLELQEQEAARKLAADKSLQDELKNLRAAVAKREEVQ